MGKILHQKSYQDAIKLVEKIEAEKKRQPKAKEVLKRKTGLSLEEKIERLHGKKKERYYQKLKKIAKWRD